MSVVCVCKTEGKTKQHNLSVVHNIAVIQTTVSLYIQHEASQMALVVRSLPANAGDASPILGQEDPLEEAMVPHSSILVWRIPWTEEPGGLQSIGLQRVRHI